MHDNALSRTIFDVEEGEIKITYPAILSQDSVNDFEEYMAIFMRRLKRLAKVSQLNDQEYNQWLESEDYSRIANNGERAYLLRNKAGDIPADAEIDCPYADDTKEHRAWHDGYSWHGN